MPSNAFLVDINNHIATLTLNRPEIHNAFDDVLIAELITALKNLESDKNVRVVLLAANGKNFSAGADIHWMKRMANFSEAENFNDAMQLARLMQTLNQLQKPTIALVQGAVFGGGVGLVACCDIALASPEASFCLSEVKIGLIPAVISPYVIAAIGERSARRYFLTAEKFDAQEALRLNLIHQIVPSDQLRNTALQIAENLLANSPQAIVSAKNLIAQVANNFIDENLIEKTAKEIAKIRVSKEGQEGLNAFLEKRKANWT
jgi:methylglutaconyl-CoA hydratase